MPGIREGRDRTERAVGQGEGAGHPGRGGAYIFAWAGGNGPLIARQVAKRFLDPLG